MVPIFEVSQLYDDLSMVGKLKGHLSNVVAIEVIEGTPMVLTIDDVPVIKTWDIRRLQCLKSIEFPKKLKINFLLCLNNLSKLAIIGTRINLVSYVPINDNEDDSQEKSNVPLCCRVDHRTNTLFLATLNDLRVIDLYTGRTEKIVTNLVSCDNRDELSKFELLNNYSKFIISDLFGNVMLYEKRNKKTL